MVTTPRHAGECCPYKRWGTVNANNAQACGGVFQNIGVLRSVTEHLEGMK